MKHSFFSLIRQFQACQQGVVLVIGAITLVPLLLMTGLAVDGAMFFIVDRKMQQAADAAVHAGVVKYQQTNDAIIAQQYTSQIFLANTSTLSNVSSPSISVDSTKKAVTLSTSVVVPTIFMKIGGFVDTTLYVTSTAQKPVTTEAEVAIVIDSSKDQAGDLDAISKSLQKFVNNLPDDVLVSFVPISTEVRLSTSTMNQNQFNAILSPTSTDESIENVYFPINTLNNNPWSSFLNLANYFFSSSFPTGISSTKKNYSYTMNSMKEILPLTKNKQLLNQYLDELENFKNGSDGLFTSLIVWGWRTIAPNWSNIFYSNGDSSTISRSSGIYPKEYGKISKSIIIIANNPSYWDDMEKLDDIYKDSCSSGNFKWKMTLYGMIPLPSDVDGKDDDKKGTSACENYYYQPVDRFFGLNYTAPDNVTLNMKKSTYRNNILNQVDSKLQKICTNIKNKGITIYVVSEFKGDSFQSLSNCAGNNNNVYSINGNIEKNHKLDNALTSISQKIVNSITQQTYLKSQLVN